MTRRWRWRKLRRPRGDIPRPPAPVRSWTNTCNAGPQARRDAALCRPIYSPGGGSPAAPARGRAVGLCLDARRRATRGEKAPSAGRRGSASASRSRRTWPGLSGGDLGRTARLSPGRGHEGRGHGQQGRGPSPSMAPWLSCAERGCQGVAGHAGASTPCGPTRGGEPQKRGRSGKGLVLVKRPQTYKHIHHHHRHATTMTVTLVPRRPAHSRPFISPLKLKPTTIQSWAWGPVRSQFRMGL